MEELNIRELRDALQSAETRAQQAEARVAELMVRLGDVAPEEPMNQDEQGGCVWCGGSPPGEPYGYAGADPKHHDPDCAWLLARQALGASHG